MLIQNLFHHDNLKDYQTKVLSLQDKSTFNHGKIVNIYIFYELDKTYVKTHPTLVNCLFGAVSITKNADIDKNKYSGYGIGFDRTSVCSY